MRYCLGIDVWSFCLTRAGCTRTRRPNHTNTKTDKHTNIHTLKHRVQNRVCLLSDKSYNIFLMRHLPGSRAAN